MAGEDCSRSTARIKLNRLDAKFDQGLTNCNSLKRLTFPGRGQNKTPAGTFAKFLEVAAQLPGLPFDRIRRKNPDTTKCCLWILDPPRKSSKGLRMPKFQSGHHVHSGSRLQNNKNPVSSNLGNWKSSLTDQSHWIELQFPGARQRKTPAGTFAKFLEVLDGYRM